MTLLVPATASARDWPGWLASCGAQARCGTFDVPLDRANPAAGTIGLNVVVIPAVVEAAREPDAIAPIAGGPGGASTGLVTWAQATFFSAAQHRDILLVDQRGTGKSKPLFSRHHADRSVDPDRIRAYWMSCLGSAGVDPRLLTTAAAMDDLDDVRAALGYPQLDLYGGSYGATAAQYYLLRHGDHARAVILDGGTLLDVPIFERYARTGQAMLTALFARCAPSDRATGRSPRLHAISGGLLAARPAASEDQGHHDRSRPFRVGRAVPVAEARNRRRIPLFLRLVANGNPAGALSLIELPTDDSRPAADGMVDPVSRALGPLGRSGNGTPGAGSYLGTTMVRSARYASAACAVWPPFTDVPGAASRVPSSVPALVVVGGQTHRTRSRTSPASRT